MGYVTEKFSRRLKELREESGLTQEQLANELGVSRGAISYYEKGTRTPDIEFIDSLYAFFNFEYPIEYIMGYSNNKKKDYVDMFELYGLTDYACKVLSEPTTELGETISTIVEHKDFMELKKLLRRYTKSYVSLVKPQIGYISFLTSNLLTRIIHDSLEIEIYNNDSESALFDNVNDSENQQQQIEALERSIQFVESLPSNKNQEHNQNDDFQDIRDLIEIVGSIEMHADLD